MPNPTNKPNLTRTSTFDAKKQYTNARFQQGTPILDVDLNDAQDYVQHQSNQVAQSLYGYGTKPVSYFEFCPRPVTRQGATASSVGDHDRNADNVAVTLGRIPTRLGIVDALSTRNAALYDFVIFDYLKIDSAGETKAADHGYNGNYLFKGKVTSAGVGNTLSLVDENKNFMVDHRLLGWTQVASQVFGTSGAAVGSPLSTTSPGGAVGNLQTKFTEGSCRILFHEIGGVAQSPPLEKEISAVTSTTELAFVGAIGQLQLGDTYTIVPANTLKNYRDDYDANTSGASYAGYTSVGTCLHYLQCFKEDVSSDEDADLFDSNLGMESTHRTQLRWCYRIMQLHVTDSTYDGTFDSPHTIHLYNVLGSLGEDPYVDRLGRNLARTAHSTLSDSDDLATAWSSDGETNFKMTDRAITSTFRQEFLSGSASSQELMRVLFEGLMDLQTTNRDDHCWVPLLWEAASNKTTNLADSQQTLSQYWFPNFPHDTSNAAAFVHSRLGIAARLDTDVVLPAFAWSMRSSMVESPVNTGWDVFNAKSVSYFGSKSDLSGYFDIKQTQSSGKLYEDRTGVEAGLSHKSLSDHIGWLDGIALGSLGLGSMGKMHPAGEPVSRYYDKLGGSFNGVLPTNRNLLARVSGTQTAPHNQPLLAAGHNLDEDHRPSEANYLLNTSADNNLIGTVFPLDVLSGSTAPATLDTENKWGGVTQNFVVGPGSYTLRDGTTITPGHKHGWSFFASESEDEYGFTSSTEKGFDFRARQWHEGLGQASNFQKNLDFRKLALKTVAHKEMDMFTIAVKPPIIATEPIQNLKYYTASGKPGFTAARDWIDPEGVGYCAIGALQDPTLRYGGPDDTTGTTANSGTLPSLRTYNWGQCTSDDAAQWGTGVGRPFRHTGSSYDVGGLPALNTVSNALDFPRKEVSSDPANYTGIENQRPANSAFNIGYLATDPKKTGLYRHHGGTTAMEALWWKGAQDTFDQPGLVKMNMSHGPWSRFELKNNSAGTGLLDDYSVHDQWENRCTSMRLRYHVGDYYPGPQAKDSAGENIAGLYHNALVDTMNLFVRIEPLSLTHWMTMPKHQHSILEHSFMFGDGLSKAIEYVKTIFSKSQFINSQDQPLTLASSPYLSDPEADDLDATRAIGDVDPYNLPFGHEHQLYVNWYHPFMDKLTAPYPYGDGYTSGKGDGSDSPKTGFSGTDKPVPYHKFGERSLVSVGNVYDRNRFVDNIEAHDVAGQQQGYRYETWRSDARILYYQYSVDTSPGFWGLGTETGLSEISSTSGFVDLISGDPNDYQIRSADSVLFLGEVVAVGSPHAGSTSVAGNTNAKAGNDAFMLGSHHNTGKDRGEEIVSNSGHPTAYTSYTNTVTFGTQDITVYSPDSHFPFIPRDDSGTWSDDMYPGPVFLPAFRAYAERDIGWSFTGATGTSTPSDQNRFPGRHGVNEMFAGATATQYTDNYYQGVTTKNYTKEFQYWPTHDAAFYARYGANWGSMSKHSMPVLRAAIRTDTLAAIGSTLAFTAEMGVLYGADASSTNPLEQTNRDLLSYWPSDDIDTVSDDLVHLPAEGPDKTCDTLFMGDLGTAVGLDDTAFMQRVFFSNPLILGMPSYDGGQSSVGSANQGLNSSGPTHNADLRDGVYRDIFELMLKERDLGKNQSDGAKGLLFVPLINTFLAIQNQGLQSKLLWNSSFRVMHVRPGGGWRPGVGTSSQDTRLKQSAQPKSITEVFLCKDRTKGRDIAMPRDPDDATTKPFLHLESMHPTAAGGAGSFQVHPNNAYMGHLYGMVCDTVGGTASKVANDNDGLEAPGSTNIVTDNPNSISGPVSWLTDIYKTGVGGDCFVGDPFDYEYSAYQHTQQGLAAGTMEVPYTDRLNSNSGIEIDLLNELRYMWDNKADLNMNTAGDFGKKWIDMVPNPADLTQPGDHEIVFVLYPGGYGQKYAQADVPAGYNPGVAGCHLTATMEINRPNEKVSSTDSGDGQHYGQTLETYNIL